MKKLSWLLTALLASGVSTPASAQYLFGFSGSQPWTLTVNGNAVTSADTGWLTDQGAHGSSNSNYIVSQGYNNIAYNDFGYFNLANLTGLGTVTSVTLSMNVADNSLTSADTFNLFDVSANYATLDADRAAGDLVGISLFNDLGSGINYGSVAVSQLTPDNSTLSIVFNVDGLAAVQSSLGGAFLVGGTLESQVTNAVPEPATWAFMILGFGAVGASMRQARRIRGTARATA